MSAHAPTTTTTTTTDAGEKRGTPGKERILRALCDADALREANELMRQCVLLLHYGYCSSLAAVEEQMRHLQLNAHLIAVPFEPAALPSGAMCRNPFRIESGAMHAAPERNCAFLVSLNVEGERAVLHECAQYGADTAADNLNRLRGDCGFLVMKNSSDVHGAWRSALTNFAGEVQRAEDCATLVTGVASCKTCGRFETRDVELRALGCCETSVVCSEQCWVQHVEQEHGDVAVLATSDQASVENAGAGTLQ